MKDIYLFQEMDISRYVRTLQDRIASGVQDALRTKGYETGGFEQYVVSVSGGGVFIGAMSGGAAATGRGARALDASEELIGVSAEFRTALGTLREQLRLLSPSDETSEVDAGLAGAEEEIGATGQVRRERLDVGATAAAGLASAGALVEQITQLLTG
ncbi:hypothetical protein [Streptomyces sp. NBC_01546]|uniref:hypothetical protein n=1 Tax=Streptomyces sp. NBC_01546 TaxID=2975872 RepID=UPI003867AA53